MIQQIIPYVLPFISAFVAIMGYEYLLKKDKEKETIKFTKDMTILITKVDMLITQNTGVNNRLCEHDKLIHEHSIKIAVLEDTQSFRRIRDND